MSETKKRGAIGGAAAGNFTVKVCGKAHPWCAVCRPEQAQGTYKPPRMKKYTRPCRDCGRCDACLGLVAPEGMKVCRKCRETKPIDAFSYRRDTGGRRNACMACSNAKLQSIKCASCESWFLRQKGQERVLCPRCRPAIQKQCLNCETTFTTQVDTRRYCTPACRSVSTAKQRASAHRRKRLDALNAYKTRDVPDCSCCGETMLVFLAIDHIDGGGHKHRIETGGGGFWIWLRKNGYPAGFRILCHNCNLGRQLNGGTCPHEAETTT